jgi:divalent metal cation (Fe/Co/Zn/Cd) transporter
MPGMSPFHVILLMEKSSEIHSIKLTLGIYLFVFGMKLSVYFASGVIALFAEALHTLGVIK